MFSYFWVEHLKETLNQSELPSANDCCADNFPQNMDAHMSTITFRKSVKAIRSLEINKAAGLEQITTKLLEIGGINMVYELSQKLSEYWW